MSDPLPAMHCPICGEPNGCAPAQSGSFDTPCWCREVTVAARALSRVPEPAVGKACICPRCARADAWTPATD